MDGRILSIRKSFAFLCFLLFHPALAGAQFITIKSIPLANGDQFLVVPSGRLAMGGVNIAVHDSLADPFVNPAKGVFTSGVRVIGGPSFYRVTGDNGSARTFCLATQLGLTDWFGGVSVGVQRLGGSEPEGIFFVEDFGNLSRLSQQEMNNLYLSGYAGKRVSDRFSVAGGFSRADLDGMGGVDLLYPGSDRIIQHGSLTDFRVGLFGNLPEERSIEMVILHSRLRMTHDVVYLEYSPWFGPPNERIERNLDRTNTSGVHAGYVQPFGEHGWRIGGIATLNRKSHPKIPDYELANVPRDPGNSWACHLGIGLSRKEGPVTFGVDLVYEPAWSSTWGLAAEDIVTGERTVIPAGEKTVENDFNFHNMILRTGISRRDQRFEFQMGIRIKWNNYRLVQIDNRVGTTRAQNEDWTEWSPSIGFSYDLGGLTVAYTGIMTLGLGTPGAGVIDGGMFAALDGGDFVIAPGGPLLLGEESVITHQISVEIPFND